MTSSCTPRSDQTVTIGKTVSLHYSSSSDIDTHTPPSDNVFLHTLVQRLPRSFADGTLQISLPVLKPCWQIDISRYLSWPSSHLNL